MEGGRRKCIPRLSELFIRSGAVSADVGHGHAVLIGDASNLITRAASQRGSHSNQVMPSNPASLPW